MKWKRLLINQAPRSITRALRIGTSKGHTMDVSSATSKKLYKALVTSKRQNITSKQKWANLFPSLETAHEDLWKYVFEAPYRWRETKLQAFQYKVLHRIVPCNKFLANIRIKQDSTCTFCNDSDTIQHFFMECRDTQRFWNSLCR